MVLHLLWPDIEFSPEIKNPAYFGRLLAQGDTLVKFITGLSGVFLQLPQQTLMTVFKIFR